MCKSGWIAGLRRHFRARELSHTPCAHVQFLSPGFPVLPKAPPPSAPPPCRIPLGMSSSPQCRGGSSWIDGHTVCLNTAIHIYTATYYTDAPSALAITVDLLYTGATTGAAGKITWLLVLLSGCIFSRLRISFNCGFAVFSHKRTDLHHVSRTAPTESLCKTHIAGMWPYFFAYINTLQGFLSKSSNLVWNIGLRPAY